MSFKEIFKLFTREGFTLVELLVAIAVLASLAGGTIIAINPAGQFNKANDAKRQKDLSQIKQALEVFYHDKSCYPKVGDTGATDFMTALTNGGEWSQNSGATVYMKKVPRDPNGSPYYYITDTASTCPQWAVVFAQLNNTSLSACNLDKATCFPGGTITGNWACSTVGYTNCKLLAAGTLGPTGVPNATPTTQVGVTLPTPTSIPGSFDVLMNSVPQFTSGLLSPYTPATSSDPVSLSVKVQDLDANGNVLGHIQTVKATVSTDTKLTTYTLVRDTSAGGDDTNGTWKLGTPFTTGDTIASNYKITLEAADDAAHSSQVTISVK